MRKIADLFWPSLEEPPASQITQDREALFDDLASIRSIDWSKNINLAIREASRIVSEEEDRRRTADNKATNVLLITAALISLYTYLETAVWDGKIGTAPKIISIPFLLIATVYLIAASGWALRTLAPRPFHRIYVTDLVEYWKQEEPETHLIKESLVAVRRNQFDINEKLSLSLLAQAYLYRAITAFGLLLLIQGGFTLFHTSSN